MIDDIDIVTRRRILFFIIVGFVIIISFKLFSLQILEQSEFTQRAKGNSVKKIVEPAPRGVFYDYNNHLLVSNKASFTMQVIPNEFDWSKSALVEKVLGVEKGYIKKILRKKKHYSKYFPVRIKKDVPFKVISWYEENSSRLRGLTYKVEFQRDYSFGVVGSHMFGYTNEISASLLKKLKGQYSRGDFIGVIGLERSYEKFLRGKKGTKFIVVDAKGKFVRPYRNGSKDVPPEKGEDLILTIDKKTQEETEKLLQGKRGAVVAIDPVTGGIIAFVSSPEYDLSNFASVIPAAVLDSLNNDPDKPLFNRASMAVHSPGSTFKMLVALAFLEEGIVTTRNIVNCKGGLQFGNRFFECTHVHGRVNVEEAIEKSCNTFFYTYIQKLGLEKLNKYARMFGFGRKTGIDIYEEARGLIPDKKYYDRVYGRHNWSRGVLLNLSIGQGEIGVTPLQLAQYTALLANYGKTGKPHFVYAARDSKTSKLKVFRYDTIKVNVSKKNLAIVRKGMYDVVNRKGTATHIALPDLKIAGKTGTVQNPHGKDHAVFVAFAPYEKPRIAVAVLVENVGYGATYAAPIAQKVITTYLRYKLPEPQRNEAKGDSLAN